MRELWNIAKRFIKLIMIVSHSQIKLCWLKLIKIMESFRLETNCNNKFFAYHARYIYMQLKIIQLKFKFIIINLKWN